MARRGYPRYTPMRRHGYARKQDVYSTRNKPKNVKMGKKFRTRSGKYGCYVYTNGKRTHFEESRR